MDRYFSSLAELWPAIFYTTLQSTLSAGLTVILASLAALGLVACSGRFRTSLEVSYLLPSLLPPLFIVLSTMTLFSGQLPYGWPLLVIVHTLMNIGVCAYILALALEQRASAMISLGMVDGSSTITLLKECLKGPLRPVLKSLFWLVFLFCWMSFSVAVQLGGMSGATIEVAIFEKIRGGDDFLDALFLSLLQFMFLFIAGVWVLRKEKLKWPQRNWRLNGFGSKWFLLFGLIPVALFFFGFFKGMKPDSFYFFNSLEWQEVGHKLVANTLFVGFGVSCVTAAFLLFLCAIWPSPFFRFFFSGVTQVSTSLLGLGFLYKGYDDWVLYKLIIGLSFFTIPWLYRFRIESILDELESQILYAQTLGASMWQILINISGPQILPDILVAVGLAAFFAMGDFGFSIFVTSGEHTLSLLVENLLANYRMEAALGVLTLLLVISCGVLLLFGGLADVARRKLS